MVKDISVGEIKFGKQKNPEKPQLCSLTPRLELKPEVMVVNSAHGAT